MKLSSWVAGAFVILALALSIPRFFEFSSLCPRSYECASLFRAPTGPFQANFNFHRPQICGDLASMANRPDYCVYRPENFLTDVWGFRNSPEAKDENNDVLVFGDSFTLGQGLDQDQIISAQLKKILGRNVYNGGGKFELEYMKYILDHLSPAPKVVVFLHLERHHHRPDEIGDWEKSVGQNLLLERIRVLNDTLKMYNPLKIFSTQLDKKFFSGKIFPNRFEENVPVFNLKDHRPFLFYKLSVDRFGDPRPGDAERESTYFSLIQAKLKERHIQFVVGLIPEKFSVYASLLENPPAAAGNSSFYLDDLDRALQEKGVTSVNFLPVFKEEAKKRMELGQYIYWPDDTHWNAAGVESAALQLKPVLLKTLLARGGL